MLRLPRISVGLRFNSFNNACQACDRLELDTSDKLRRREAPTVSMFRPIEPTHGDRDVRRERDAAFRPVVGLALVLGMALVIFPCTRARAQTPTFDSLNDLVLIWIQGNYASPLICKIDGRAQRGLRRILIEPGFGRALPAEGTIRFVDLELEDGSASRCFTEIGGSTPNITGELRVRHPNTKPRDTAVRDFKAELRRKRGFELDIVKGRLQLSEVGADPPVTESLDFRGGKLRIHLLRQGSDALRLLKALPSPRKLLLEFEARDGRTFSFPASLAKPKTDPDPRSQAR